MKRYIWIVCVFLCSIIAASAVEAGDFDGTRPLLVSVIRAVECVPDGTCREVPLASVELPQFLKIDFTKKTIRPADADDETPDTVIERQEVVDGKLILQGAEDGYEKMRDGWSRLDHGNIRGNWPGGVDSLRRSGGLCGFWRCHAALAR
ncbi:MAG: hypothetical protein ACYTEU_08990 [Planctomycetota bacterium]|jgi:hypothetical protein